ncbi:N-acetylmuramoyl-L-alanine amidase [Paenibacillus phyllosphaerae]|uniref:N-acetylmuramoyl-L-alanine amidase n=1 Tax=Paenibacillus phyllosphaerae TaxID=274593 RepID=A0A7W5FM90_9BACL|nr:N-acetylmuramoyl-L-alanine amidase [Paenibacillus phyllosphaerae]MBB3110021.1 N-acetylmuramoyl-L-alanine amidase [Paenibacillus phyllosphaerae]
MNMFLHRLRRSRWLRQLRPLLTAVTLLSMVGHAVPASASHAVSLTMLPAAEEASNEAVDNQRLDDPRYSRALPSAEVLIDIGHGGVDGGAVYQDTLEKDINLAIGKKLYLLLRSSGIRAILNRDGDYALSDDNRWHGSRSRHQRDLSQRSQLSKEIDTALVVSLHVNWSSSERVHGPLVLHQPEGQSTLLASCIQLALNEQQHKHAVPRLGKPFYLLKVVQSPAVIVEMGYISNGHDRAMLTNPRTQLAVADAIASGVRNYILLR